jgi:hypothetical protein
VAQGVGPELKKEKKIQVYSEMLVYLKLIVLKET